MDVFSWQLGLALISQQGQILHYSHSFKALKGYLKAQVAQFCSPSPRLYRRRASHASRASLLSKPSRVVWVRQRTARVNATPSFHCPTSSPQISSNVVLSLSLLPCTLSDLSLKTSRMRQSGPVGAQKREKRNKKTLQYF